MTNPARSLAVTALLLLMHGCRASAKPPGTGLSTQLTVEQFRTIGPAPRAWAAGTFAESLAASLGRMPGLSVHLPAGGGGSDFVLRGDVTQADHRLVVTARLHERGAAQPFWSATFWRAESTSVAFAPDLAADVAEALYGHLARSNVTVGGK